MIPAEGCGLFGAYRCAIGIKDSAVLMHSVIGCSMGTLRNHFTSQMNDIRQMSTVLYERDIALGGERNLRKAIRYALGAFHASVLFVVVGCTPEIMNDDVEGVIHEFCSEIPIIPILAAGFRGGCHVGTRAFYEKLMTYMHKRTTVEKSVNLIGLFSDDYQIEQDLQQIRSLLGPDIKLNSILCCDSFERICAAPDAAWNLVLPGYEWIGEELQKRFGIPYCCISYPYGLAGSEHFIKTVYSLFAMDPTDRLREINEYATPKIAEIAPYVGNLFQIPCTVIGNQVFGAALSAMLGKELGMSVKFYSTEQGLDLAQVEKESLSDLSVMLFGDSLDGGIAQKCGIPLLRYCYPVSDQVRCSRKCYAGVEGFLFLLEDIINTAAELADRLPLGRDE